MILHGLPLRRLPRQPVRLLLSSFTKPRRFSTARSPHFHLLAYTAGAASVGVGVYFGTKSLQNESQSIRGGPTTPTHVLIPDLSQDTLEMGLYSASQKEIEDARAKRRALQTSRKYLGVLFRIKYFLDDYIVEPLVTLGRFCQLTALFLPVVLVYPMVLFGRIDKSGQRSGARIWYSLVRRAAEASGASFIKLGQWAASRTDIFSQGFCDELSRLHSNARSHSWQATRRIISEEFAGLSVDDLFDEFYPEPIGTGAIAQVYLAKVNRNFAHYFFDKDFDSHDSLVAVKVVHPGVRASIERDLKIMGCFASFLNSLPTMEWLSFPEEVHQFAMLMRLQLDMRIEAQNLDKFRANFASQSQVKFPAPRFSSRRILIEERIQGISMNTVLSIPKDHMCKLISDTLVDSFLKMLIADNFVHADLHPGNIFVRLRKDGKSEAEIDRLMGELVRLDNDKLSSRLESLYEDGFRPQVCFIDAGLVTELNERNRYNFISLFNALSQFDGYRAGELMIERSKTPETAVDVDLFKYKVEKLVDQVRRRTFTLGSISIGDILEQMLSIVRVHHVRLEGDFVTVVVAILLLEGIGRQLDPDLDLFARSLPILRQIGFKEGKLIFQDQSTLAVVKVWLTLEARQFINASVHDVYKLVKCDGLSPNY